MPYYVQTFAQDATGTLHVHKRNPLHMARTRPPADQLATVKLFRGNAAALLAAHSETQQAIADRAGVSLRALQYAVGIGQNMDVGGHAPTLRTIEAVARGLGVEVWQLLLPDLQAEVILNSSARQTIRKYLRTSPEGRTAIDTIAAAVPDIGQKRVN